MALRGRSMKKTLLLSVLLAILNECTLSCAGKFDESGWKSCNGPENCELESMRRLNGTLRYMDSKMGS